LTSSMQRTENGRDERQANAVLLKRRNTEP
jgi:hypothetical protein